MMRTIRSSIYLLIILSLVGCDGRFYHLTTVSPGNSYKILLSETKTEISDKDRWPYKVFLEIEKSGQVILQNEVLYSGDDMDARFGNIASESEWLNEKTLKLSRRKFDKMQVDHLEIHNDSGNRLTYALIAWSVSDPNPNERFLILDIQPNERVMLPVTSNETDYSWVSCSGRFENGKKVTQVRRGFKMDGVCKPPSHYFITIKDDQTLIESQECKPTS
jgi:hypothetical protein